MNGRQFAKYLARDLHCPCGCSGKEDTFVPQHRAGRGMGGSKTLDRPSNIIVLCSLVNWAIEADAEWAARARDYGWKLPRWKTPEETPFYDRATGGWYLIDNDYNRKAAGWAGRELAGAKDLTKAEAERFIEQFESAGTKDDDGQQETFDDHQWIEGEAS